MKIERLLFQVSPSDYSKDFLIADSEVWNPWLKRQPGFLNKTSRIVSPGAVELLIFWKSERCMKDAGSKVQEIKNLGNLMKQRFSGNYRLIQSS